MNSANVISLPVLLVVELNNGEVVAITAIRAPMDVSAYAYTSSFYIYTIITVYPRCFVL